MVGVAFVRLVKVVDDLFVEAGGVEGTHAREVAAVVMVDVTYSRVTAAKSKVRIAVPTHLYANEVSCGDVEVGMFLLRVRDALFMRLLSWYVILYS